MINFVRVFFGGSFDPVHLGHQAMMQAVFKQLQQHLPDKPIVLSFLPTAGNPLKSAPTSSAHRLAMLNLAINNTPFKIDTSEIYQTPPVFTVDTVKKLKNLYPNDWLIFIVGQDSLANFDRWKDGNTILSCIQFWVFSRKQTPDIIDSLQDKITDDFYYFIQNRDAIFWDKTIIPDISSSLIRNYLQKKPQLAQDLLMPAVMNYIKTHKLYQIML